MGENQQPQKIGNYDESLNVELFLKFIQTNNSSINVSKFQVKSNVSQRQSEGNEASTHENLNQIFYSSMGVD